MKVYGHLRARLEEQGDLRVKVCSPLGGHKPGNTGSASTPGHGTSRSSSRSRGGGRSWKGVVEAAVEVRLIIWGGGRWLEKKDLRFGRDTEWSARTRDG